MTREDLFARGKRKATTGGGTKKCDNRTPKSLRFDEKTISRGYLPAGAYIARPVQLKNGHRRPGPCV